MAHALSIAVTLLGYLSASIFYVASFYDKFWADWARKSLLTGWLGQSVFFGVNVFGAHQFPGNYRIDWNMLFVWVSITVYLGWRYVSTVGDKLIGHVGGFLVPTVFGIWLISQAFVQGSPYVPSADHPWQMASLLISIGSDVAFLFANVFGIMYIEKERELKNKNARLFYYRLPALEKMDRLGSRMIYLGTLLLVGSIGLGFMHSSSRTIPDIGLWSFLILGIYIMYMILRGMGWRGHRLAFYEMTAFLVVVLNFWG